MSIANILELVSSDAQTADNKSIMEMCNESTRSRSGYNNYKNLA